MDAPAHGTDSLLVRGDGTGRPVRKNSHQLCPPWNSASVPVESDEEPEHMELVSNLHYSEEGEISGPDEGDAEIGALQIDYAAGSPGRLSLQPWWASLARRTKFGTYYLVYCVVCLLLTGILLMVSIWEEFAPRKEARFWRRELRPWEEATEAFVGAALCAETFAVLIGLGPQAIMRDRWRLFDAAIAAMTLLCGLFFVFRRAIKGAQRVIEDFDMPILALRFALLPLRMVSTSAMVVRAQRQRRRRKPDVEAEEIHDPRKLDSFSSVLTPKLASELRELLPCYLRFVDWHLGYAPSKHGTSLRTFYRQQAGPNLFVVRDAHGGLFGGFATEAWRQTSGGYGTGESFVFVIHPASAAEQAAAVSPTSVQPGGVAGCPEEIPLSGLPAGLPKEQWIEVFRATMQRGEVIQWSDSKMLGFGHAVVVFDDFLHGSSSSCQAFGSQLPLSPAGTDFVIRDFECWHIGTPHRTNIPDE